jgi:peptidoglycan-N-acetylglucosamine deacetylase
LLDATAKLAKEQARSVRALLAPSRRVRPNSDQAPMAVGFFVNWDDASLSSLKANLDSLDLLIPE